MDQHGHHPSPEPGGERRCIKIRIPVVAQNISVTPRHARKTMLSEYLIHLLTHMLAARRLKVAHRALHVGMTEPLLNGAEIDTCPQTPRSEGRPEFVEPEVIWIKLRAFGHGFQTV
jgi:hypothetical protein